MQNHSAHKTEAQRHEFIQDSLIKLCDSLNGEIFTMKIDMQRYEYIFDQIQESSSKECKQQLEEILKHTE